MRKDKARLTNWEQPALPMFGPRMGDNVSALFKQIFEEEIALVVNRLGIPLPPPIATYGDAIRLALYGRGER